MHHKIEPKATSTNCPTKPFKTELYIRMLDVTGSIKNEYKDFIKSKPISIQNMALEWWLNPTCRTDYP